MTATGLVGFGSFAGRGNLAAGGGLSSRRQRGRDQAPPPHAVQLAGKGATDEWLRGGGPDGNPPGGGGSRCGRAVRE